MAGVPLGGSDITLQPLHLRRSILLAHHQPVVLGALAGDAPPGRCRGLLVAQAVGTLAALGCWAAFRPYGWGAALRGDICGPGSVVEVPLLLSLADAHRLGQVLDDRGIRKVRRGQLAAAT